MLSVKPHGLAVSTRLARRDGVWPGGRAQLPLRAGVGDAESGTLGIALGTAAGFGDHHRQVAAVFKGIAHTLLKQRRLQPAPTQFGYRRRAGEQSHSIVHGECACCSRLAVDFGKKAHAMLAIRGDGGGSREEIAQFRIIVCPGSCAYLRPEGIFGGMYYPYRDIAVFRGRERFTWPIEDAADLDGPIVTGAEQVQRGVARERAHLEIHRRCAIEEETLDSVERDRSQIFEYAETKALGHRRGDSVEDRVCTTAFDASGTAFGEQTTSCQSKLCTRVPFCAFQSPARAGGQRRAYGQGTAYLRDRGAD